MKEITTVGLDLAKNVFQVHGIDAEGAVVMRRQIRRAQMLLFFSRLAPCLIGIEACAGAHHWARELTKFGHEVRLIPFAIGLEPMAPRWLSLTSSPSSSGARPTLLTPRRSAPP